MKIKTSWNLGLLYKNDKDPQIEADLLKIEQKCEEFQKKYAGQPFTATPEALAKAFADKEALSEEIGGDKPWWYFTLKADLNSSDTKVAAMATKIEQRITDAFNKIKFFGLDIAKIPERDHSGFLLHPALKEYEYTLTKIFKRAKHNLTEGEEQLEDLLSQTSYTMWVDMVERALGKQTITHKGKVMPLSKAISGLSDMPTKDRRSMHEKINLVLKSVSPLAEAEINAVYNFKKVLDARRGFEKPYSGTILYYENDEKSITDFVKLVTKNFSIAHRFYKLHARLLGEKKLSSADRGAKIGEIKTKFTFDASVAILRNTLEKFDPEYVGILDSYLQNGQIDVYPKTGKKSGAYCWSMNKLPTYVMLNHVDTVRSAETLAHEMGHAIHTELSKTQPPRYRGHSTATAEVASTFFEQLISEEIEKRLTEKEKITLLHNKIMGDIATIFRQIACFNFELELHEKIRSEGQMSKENIAALMNKHMQSYLGGTFNMSPDDGYYYVAWSHIRRFFYVYSYAYGQIISRALYENWKKNPEYSAKIKQFLLAGRSMSPEDIFKSVGIETNTKFFEAGLKSIEKDIERLEQLTAQTKTQNTNKNKEKKKAKIKSQIKKSVPKNMKSRK